jgi:DNA repair protein RecO (recombination protein O)
MPSRPLTGPGMIRVAFTPNVASRTYRAEAIVLRTFDLGETDRILTLLTRHFGKLRIIAKGIRRPTSRMAGHAEPLVHGTFQLARGRELDVLTGAESRAAHRSVREDLVRIAAGWYLSELTDRFTVERAPSSPVFELLATALRYLDAGYRPEVVCRWFDLHLLDRTGFRPELARCVQCRAEPAEAPQLWSVAAGGLVCTGCLGAGRLAGAAVPLSVRALKSLRYLLVSELADAVRLRLDSPLADEIERALRAFLQHVLDRDVRSAALLDQIARLPRAATLATR